MADDYLKYITGEQGAIDPYAVNPFSESAPPGEEGATPFAEELPFRFTQFAINPSAQATSGQQGRAPVARSPYTSGALASELRSLQDRIAGLPTSPPGEMPIAPVAPEMPDLSRFKQEQQPYNIDAQGRARTGFGTFSTFNSGNIQPSSMRDFGDLRWGLPIKEYQVPARLLEEYPGRNPVDLAIQYSSGKGFSKFSGGPMSTVQGYDMEKLLGTDKWNEIINAKSRPSGSEQRLYYNLGILPTSINPELGKKEHIMSLAVRDFTDVNRTLVDDPKALAAAAEMGYDVSNGLPDAARIAIRDMGMFIGDSRIKDPNYKFNPEDAKYFLQTNPEVTGLRGFAQEWAPKIIQAGAAAVIGGALGGILGPALGLVGGAGQAGGLAGVMGMSPGIAATGTNLLASTAANLAASKGLEAAGVNLNNPLARMGLGIAGGALGNLGGAGTDASLVEQANQNLSQLEAAGMTAEEIESALGMTAEEYIQSYPDMVRGMVERGEMVGNITQGPSGEVVGSMQPAALPGSQPDFNYKKFGVQGLQSGIESYKTVADRAAALRGSSGIDITSLYNPEAISMANLYNSRLNIYNDELARYEEEMAAYNEAVEQMKLREQLQAEYESKMSDFIKQTDAFRTYNELRSKQAGISSNIAESIAANPFYDPEENLTGIQSRLF